MLLGAPLTFGALGTPFGCGSVHGGNTAQVIVGQSSKCVRTCESPNTSRNQPAELEHLAVAEEGSLQDWGEGAQAMKRVLLPHTQQKTMDSGSLQLARVLYLMTQCIRK